MGFPTRRGSVKSTICFFKEENFLRSLDGFSSSPRIIHFLGGQNRLKTMFVGLVLAIISFLHNGVKKVLASRDLKLGKFSNTLRKIAS